MNNKSVSHYIVILSVIVAAVFINLITISLSKKIQLRYDMTQNRIFELSENTIDYLNAMDGNVTFYYMTDSSGGSPYVNEVLGRYARASKKINIQAVDFIKDPAFASKYSHDGSKIAKGSIIVESSKRFTVVDSGATLAVNKNAKGNITRELGFSLEQKLTNAVNFVLNDKNITVKYTVNHGEADFKIPASKLREENIDVTTVNLSEETINNDNTDLLILFGLRTELSDEEYRNIEKYLDGGGKVFILSNPATNNNKIKLLSEKYGIRINNDAATEGNPIEKIENNKLYLVVNQEKHKITENIINRGKLLFPAACTVTVMEKNGYDISYLAKTKESAESRVLTSEGLGYVIEKGNLGMAALSENKTNNSMVFAAGTTQLLSSVDPNLGNLMDSSTYINREFFVQTVKYMTDSSGMLVSVNPKNIMVKSVNLTTGTQILLIIVCGFMLPMSVIGAGIIVWLRRKNL